MQLDRIVRQLQEERDRLDAALKALTKVAGVKTRGRRRRTMSASARKRISLAQKARWAKVNRGK